VTERRSVHLMGVGGIGVSALARIALSRGWRVTGCDRSESPLLAKLRGEGAEIAVGHGADHVSSFRPDLLIYTAAVPAAHPELEAARLAGVEVVGRAEYLGRLMADHPGPRVSIAGSHGKSTTTGMVTCALSAAGVDPTCLIGAEYRPIGGNVRLGESGVFVTESCEAYSSFHALRPDVAVVTSADADHLDHYGTAEAVLASFVRFCQGLSQGGKLIHCADDPSAAEVARRVSAVRPDVLQAPYSASASLDDGWVAVGAVQHEGRTVADVAQRVGGRDLRRVSLTLRVPGEYNVRNALAALAVAEACGADPDVAAQALATFTGVGRRFELVGERAGVEVWDDYAHHPTEINALIGGVRAWRPGRRLVVVFQPHLYSRTRDFMQGFAEALAAADIVIIDRIYAAREPDTMGVHGSHLVAAIGAAEPDKTVLYADSDAEAVGYLRRITRAGDVVLTVGAGDVDAVGRTFVAL
jgi:UDP-N-acetylmuramate--alanine ligase